MDGFIRRHAVLCLLVSAALWSSTGVAARLVECDALTLLVFRAFIALVVVSPLLGQLKRLPDRAEFAGGVFGALTSLLYFISAQNGSPATAIVLLYTVSLWSALLGRLFGNERLPSGYWIAALAVITGVAMMVGEKAKLDNFLATAAGLGAGLAFGITLQCLPRQREPSDRGMLLALALPALFGIPIVASRFSEVLSTQRTIAGVALAGVSTGVAYFLLTRSVRHVEPTRAAIIQAAEVPLVAGIVAIAFREIPSPVGICGALLVFVTTVWVSIATARKLSS